MFHSLLLCAFEDEIHKAFDICRTCRCCSLALHGEALLHETRRVPQRRIWGIFSEKAESERSKMADTVSQLSRSGAHSHQNRSPFQQNLPPPPKLSVFTCFRLQTFLACSVWLLWQGWPQLHGWAPNCTTFYSRQTNRINQESSQMLYSNLFWAFSAWLSRLEVLVGFQNQSFKIHPFVRVEDAETHVETETCRKVQKSTP